MTNSDSCLPDLHERRRASYLVRVWREETADGAGDLRGSVRDLATGTECYFADPAELLEILATATEVPARVEVTA